MDQRVSYPYEQDHRVLKFLAALSYRSGEIGSYLHEIAVGVSHLVASDWSIVTVCENDTGQVVASSLGLTTGDHQFAAHGTLAGEIVRTGRSLLISDIRQQSTNQLPGNYLCYLGVPLRTPTGNVIGTICSFFCQPRQLTSIEIQTVELFAERAATAIDNYRLYQQQQKFNELLEREVFARTEELRIAQAKLIDQERLAAIGEFAAMIVHEVRNPLSTIELGLKFAQKVLSAPSAQERLALSLSEIARLKHLLNEILHYAKPQDLQLSEITIDTFLAALVVSLQDLDEAVDRHIEFSNQATNVVVLGDPDKLRQVFINLFRNAFEAIAPGAVVRCALTANSASGQVCVSVQNGGDPIPPDILTKLATPFYSTKAAGTGLGLAIVKRIVQAHGGQFLMESDWSTGTVMWVHLPIAPNASV